VTVARRVPFPDHHVFSPDELRELIKLAFAEGAELMTTEKDYFRLRLEQREGIVPVPAGVVFDDQKAINRILDLVMPEYEEPMR
jgi:tetraacyldisaccharide 4'-kinase